MTLLRRRLAPVLAALVASVSIVGPGSSTVVEAAPRFIQDSTSRPLGAVTVIGDSVLLGSLLIDPTIVDRLGETGWGPIRAQAGEGYSTGYFGAENRYEASYWIETWRAGGWDAPNVLVNLGANDSGFCGSSQDCAYRAITHLADTIGPGRQIWWPQITRLYTHFPQQNAWNLALEQVAAERANFHTWDWPTVMANGPFPSHDATHLSGDGYRLRSELMAQQFTLDLARADEVADDTALPEPIGDPTEYVPLDPVRVVDSRDTRDDRLPAGGTLTVDLSGYVPDGTTAVAVNLTSAKSTASGFLTAHPCDRAPGEVSSVNHTAGVPRGALAIIPLSADGELCVVTAAPGHVVVDLQGAFVPTGGLRFSPTDPSRLADTRDTGRENPLVVAVPAGADAVAVNLTAVRGERGGFLTADSCTGERSAVSNVNYLAGEPVAGAAIVPVSDDDTICVWSSTPVDVAVDITGTFAADGELRFQPVEPTRMIDVRDGTGGWSPIMGVDQAIDAPVAPDGVGVVTGTLTLVRPLTRGFAALDCGPSPETSNVNATEGAAMANAATVPIADGGVLCIWSSTVAKVLFDTTGWWVP